MRLDPKYGEMTKTTSILTFFWVDKNIHLMVHIGFTYQHGIFPTISSKEKLNKHNMLIQVLRTYGWKIDPLITITMGVRGTIHEHAIQALGPYQTAGRQFRSAG